MYWYHYLSGFFAGVALANAIPHFVNGISGNYFPTPFAKPHGIGLSSPILNVIWGLFNLLIGYFLFCFGKISSQNKLSLLTCFLGALIIAIYLSKRFVHKEKS